MLRKIYKETNRIEAVIILLAVLAACSVSAYQVMLDDNFIAVGFLQIIVILLTPLVFSSFIYWLKGRKRKYWVMPVYSLLISCVSLIAAIGGFASDYESRAKSSGFSIEDLFYLYELFIFIVSFFVLISSISILAKNFKQKPESA